MNNIFDFSVGFDKEIEDIVPWTDDVDEQGGEEFINRIIRERKLIVGERSEGSVSVDDHLIRVEYKWCSNVGEDWNDDSWNDEVLELNREVYDI